MQMKIHILTSVLVCVCVCAWFASHVHAVLHTSNEGQMCWMLSDRLRGVRAVGNGEAERGGQWPR